MIYSPYRPSVTGWRQVTPPAGEILDLGKAKQHLRVTHTAEDEYIESLIPVAREYIEAKDHLLAVQTWEMLLDAFPPEGITLWKNPVLAVESIHYLDSGETSQIWDAAEYQAVLTARPPQIVLATNASWPSITSRPEAVTVRFTGGYNGSPVSIPSLLMHAMKLLIGHLYIHREAVIDGTVTEIPLGLEQLIDQAISRARVY